MVVEVLVTFNGCVPMITIGQMFYSKRVQKQKKQQLERNLLDDYDLRWGWLRTKRSQIVFIVTFRLSLFDGLELLIIVSIHKGPQRYGIRWRRPHSSPS